MQQSRINKEMRETKWIHCHGVKEYYQTESSQSKFKIAIFILCKLKRTNMIGSLVSTEKSMLVFIHVAVYSVHCASKYIRSMLGDRTKPTHAHAIQYTYVRKRTAAIPISHERYTCTTNKEKWELTCRYRFAVSWVFFYIYKQKHSYTRFALNFTYLIEQTNYNISGSKQQKENGFHSTLKR